MKRRALVATGLFGVAFVVLFFFYAPIVPMNIVPCVSGGVGYVSLSYHFFYKGEVDVGTHLRWFTVNEQNCGY